MQTIINVSIPEPDAKQIKEEIKQDAQKRSMSISQFLLWCWKIGRKETK